MLNMVAIMGRLTTDPELRHTTNSIPVTTFTLAVNRSYVKQGGERQTDFIDVVAWRNTAEFICRYFKKGQMMAVDGSIQTRTYTDKEGRYRKVFEILANNVYFTESRSSSTSTAYETKSVDYSDSDENFNLSFSSGDDNDFTVIDDDEDLPF